MFSEPEVQAKIEVKRFSEGSLPEKLGHTIIHPCPSLCSIAGIDMETAQRSALRV